MGLFDWINKKAPSPTVNRRVVNNAYGGVPPRAFTTLVEPIYKRIPHQRPIGGIAQPIPHVPNTAPMLRSASYHTQTAARGWAKEMPAVGFSRGTKEVHPAAVSDVIHVSPIFGVHPTTARKARRGNGSL